MTKKYNSQQMIENILTVAARLFLEKGFDKTSMQDIARTADISKGAIYHHFQSKEEIINAVMSRQSANVENTMTAWLAEMEELTGKQKLTGLLEKSFADQQLHALDQVLSTQVKSPEFVVTYMQDCVNKDSAFVSEIIKDGVADGSLDAQFPEEAAEVFLLLLNVWCDPVIFQCSPAKLTRRLMFLQQTMKAMGLDVLNDELLGRINTLLQGLRPEGGQRNA